MISERPVSAASTVSKRQIEESVGDVVCVDCGFSGSIPMLDILRTINPARSDRCTIDHFVANFGAGR